MLDLYLTIALPAFRLQLTEDELDPRVLEELATFPPATALEILDIFCTVSISACLHARLHACWLACLPGYRLPRLPLHPGWTQLAHLAQPAIQSCTPQQGSLCTTAPPPPSQDIPSPSTPNPTPCRLT